MSRDQSHDASENADLASLLHAPKTAAEEARLADIARDVADLAQDMRMLRKAMQGRES